MKPLDHFIHLSQLVIHHRFHIATDLTPRSLKIHCTLGVIDMERGCKGTLCDAYAETSHKMLQTCIIQKGREIKMLIDLTIL